MESLKGKKLLVIGGGPADVVIVNTAHEMGVYVICCARYTEYANQAKDLADEAWHIDYTHTDEIVEKARLAGVSGVIAGTDEQRVLAAVRISKKLGTPFYATEEQIELTMNKHVFKDTCTRYGVNVPKGSVFRETVTEEEKKAIRYPCIVKPVDNGGRRGITICLTDANIEEAISFAFQKSPSKTILIEDYIQGIEFAAIYTISDGKASLSIINDKYVAYLEDGTPTTLTALAISPSKYYRVFLREIDRPIKDFLAGVGIRNGVAFFQGIANEQRVTVFEMGYRMNGGNDFKQIERINGTNYLKMLICHSLTGSMGDTLERDNADFPKSLSTFLLYAHGGKIGTLDFSSANVPEAIEIKQYREVGDEIKEGSATLQRVLRVKLVCDDLEHTRRVIDQIQNGVVLKDVNGSDMLFPKFDTARLSANGDQPK